MIGKLQGKIALAKKTRLVVRSIATLRTGGEWDLLSGASTRGPAMYCRLARGAYGVRLGGELF